MPVDQNLSDKNTRKKVMLKYSYSIQDVDLDFFISALDFHFSELLWHQLMLLYNSAVCFIPIST